jgi:hypothetical protein
MSPELVRACAEAAGMPDLIGRAISIPELADEVRQEFLDARQEACSAYRPSASQTYR